MCAHKCICTEWLSEHLQEDAFDFTRKKPKLIKKPMYSWKDFAAGRSNKECYELYFTRFVPHLEKKALWNRKLSKAKEDKDLVTISSEAFGLLLLENQWKRWLKMFELSGGKVGSVEIDEGQLKWAKFTRGGTKTKKARMMIARLILALTGAGVRKVFRGSITSI